MDMVKNGVNTSWNQWSHPDEDRCEREQYIWEYFYLPVGEGRVVSERDKEGAF